MTTIKIAYEVPENIIAKIEAHIKETVRCNISWNGAVFKIERDDFTHIQNNDSADAVSLLYEINNIISGA